MRIKYLGHSAFHIHTQNTDIIVDPFITPNEKASSIDVNALKADVILLTHAHGDHIADVETIAKNNGAIVVSNYEVVDWFGKKDIQGHPLNHGGHYRADWGTAKYVNAVHSSTFPDGSPGGNPGGFVIWNDEACIYITGDTALTTDMQLIPKTCPKLDLAIMSIGDNFTMNYDDAVIAADFVNCDRVVGCHYDTFPYIEIDHEAAKQAFARAGKTLELLAIGSETEV